MLPFSTHVLYPHWIVGQADYQHYVHAVKPEEDCQCEILYNLCVSIYV